MKTHCNQSDVMWCFVAVTAVAVMLFMPAAVSAEQYSYNTRYYELVAEIGADGKKTEKSGGGQFYTVTSASCYESDKDGFDEGLGVLKYVKFQNNVYVYRGKAFYGDATYCFTSDYSHLNIKTDAGVTHVLKKMSPPKGFTASNHKSIRQGVFIPPMPVTSPTSNTNTGSKPASVEYYDCRSCYGSGKCPICNGKGSTYSIYTQATSDCPSCNGGRCSACGGTGKKTRIKR